VTPSFSRRSQPGHWLPMMPENPHNGSRFEGLGMLQRTLPIADPMMV
jgi:hypothetical protein